MNCLTSTVVFCYERISAYLRTIFLPSTKLQPSLDICGRKVIKSLMQDNVGLLSLREKEINLLRETYVSQIGFFEKLFQAKKVDCNIKALYELQMRVRERRILKQIADRDILCKASYKEETPPPKSEEPSTEEPVEEKPVDKEEQKEEAIIPPELEVDLKTENCEDFQPELPLAEDKPSEDMPFDDGLADHSEKKDDSQIEDSGPSEEAPDEGPSAPDVKAEESVSPRSSHLGESHSDSETLDKQPIPPKLFRSHSWPLPTVSQKYDTLKEIPFDKAEEAPPQEGEALYHVQTLPEYMTSGYTLCQHLFRLSGIDRILTGLGKTLAQYANKYSLVEHLPVIAQLKEAWIKYEKSTHYEFPVATNPILQDLGPARVIYFVNTFKALLMDYQQAQFFSQEGITAFLKNDPKKLACKVVARESPIADLDPVAQFFVKCFRYVEKDGFLAHLEESKDQVPKKQASSVFENFFDGLLLKLIEKGNVDFLTKPFLKSRLSSFNLDQRKQANAELIQKTEKEISAREEANQDCTYLQRYLKTVKANAIALHSELGGALYTSWHLFLEKIGIPCCKQFIDNHTLQPWIDCFTKFRTFMATYESFLEVQYKNEENKREGKAHSHLIKKQNELLNQCIGERNKVYVSFITALQTFLKETQKNPLEKALLEMLHKNLMHIQWDEKSYDYTRQLWDQFSIPLGHDLESFLTKD